MQPTRFTVYRCDVCSRQIELESEPARPDPQRCTITYKCTGHLIVIGGRNSRSELFPPVVFGLTDYIQRGTVIAQRAALQPTPQVNLLTADNQLTLAGVFKRFDGVDYFFSVVDKDGNVVDLELTTALDRIPSSATQLALQLFEVTPQFLNYSQFTYGRGANTQVVQGPDDSPSRLVLRFTSTDNVQVFVNGVQLESSQFDRTVDNVITFTPLLTDSSNVIQVFIYQDIDTLISSSTFYPVSFRALAEQVTADVGQRSVNAWGDVYSATLAGYERLLMFSQGFNSLAPGLRYGLAQVTAVGPLQPTPFEVRATDLNLLLATDPFAFEDKNLRALANLDSLATGDAQLQLTQDVASGKYSLACDETLLTSTFEPISVAPADAPTLTNANRSETSQVATQVTNPFILGPS